MLFKGLPYIIMVNNKVRQPVGHELISCGFCIFAYRVEMYFAKFAGHFCFLFSEMTVGFFFLYFLKSNLFLVVLGLRCCACVGSGADSWLRSVGCSLQWSL